MNMTDGKLDRKRSFGVVYNHPGIGFYQDNKPFRHDGTPYQEEPTSVVGPAVALTGLIQPAPIPLVQQVDARRSLQSQRMKEIWAARRAAQTAPETSGTGDANPQR